MAADVGPKPTADDYRHLAGFIAETGPLKNNIHPFTAIRWVALGWCAVVTPMGFERPGSYEWTEAGYEARRVAREGSWDKIVTPLVTREASDG